jgi:hypothetical protein
MSILESLLVLVDTVKYYSKEDNNKYNYIPRYQLDIKEVASKLYWKK